MQETTKQNSKGTPKAPRFDSISALEKLGTGVDTFRGWITQAWKVGLNMGRGAYLLSERRRLFSYLGEEVYYKFIKGELQNTELEPIIKQLERLTKKVEIEEMLIRSIRFGRDERKARKGSSATSTESEA